MFANGLPAFRSVKLGKAMKEDSEYRRQEGVECTLKHFERERKAYRESGQKLRDVLVALFNTLNEGTTGTEGMVLDLAAKLICRVLKGGVNVYELAVFYVDEKWMHDIACQLNSMGFTLEGYHADWNKKCGHHADWNRECEKGWKPGQADLATMRVRW
jgi:hypothetical protein